jgi:hypothetical protein
MDRRSFLKRAGAVPLLGALVVGTGSVLSGELPAVDEPPRLFVPERPALIAATSLQRPSLEAGLIVHDWSMRIESARPYWGSSYPVAPGLEDAPDHLITISGRMLSPVFLSGLNPFVSRRMRMYLLPEPEEAPR